MPIALFALLVAAAGVALYKQRTREMQGTWIDMFEGSSFFEDMSLDQACTTKFYRTSSWLHYYPKLNSAVGKLLQTKENIGIYESEDGRWDMTAYSVRFVGHKNSVGFGFGHLSGWHSEVMVDRMISVVPIKGAYCDIRD